MFYFVKTPAFLRQLYAKAIWHVPTSGKEIFLTFDDGPVEGITDKALAILAEYDARATFFCVGQNVVRHPELFRRIKQSGHGIGNHSFSHVNGWDTQNETYFSNVRQAAEQIPSTLFRPPYGKIKRSQLTHLSAHYSVIMWDVLSGDFDPKTSVQEIIKNVITHVRPGSIIVMHDNAKCGHKMLAALPDILRQLKGNGYTFGVIPERKPD